MKKHWTRVSNFAVRALPENLKAWLKQVRHRYLRTVHGFDATHLRAGLTRMGIGAGDVVIAHSSFNAFAGFRGTPLDVVRTLQQVVGPTGTLLMPTLPFTQSVVEYAQKNPLFDVRTTVSRMGLISEVFRRSSGVTRSLHPTHSVAAWGAKAEAFIADHHRSSTPCGQRTPYGRLLKAGGKILFLGVPVSTMTFFHFIEEDLEPLMPFRVFDGADYALRYRDADGTTHTLTSRLFSQRLAGRRNLASLVAELERRGCWRTGRIGPLRLLLLEARDVHACARSLAERGIFCYDRADLGDVERPTAGAPQ